MSALLTMLLSALVGAAADWLKTWLASEKAEQDAWAAKTLQGQLAAQARADARRRAIADQVALAAPAATPSDWNRALSAGLLFVALVLPGCVLDRTVYVEGAWPIIDAPVKPTLPVDPPTWSVREQLIVAYATKLEAALRAYDRAAIDHNANNGSKP